MDVGEEGELAGVALLHHQHHKGVARTRPSPGLDELEGGLRKVVSHLEPSTRLSL